MKYWVFIISIFFVSGTSVGQQLSDSASIELEKTSQYHLIPVDDQGILIFTNNEADVRSREKTWTFSLYDQLFNSKWKKDILIENKFDFQAYYYGQGNLYLIFNRYKKKLLKVVTLDLKDGEITYNDLETFARFDVYSFKAINNKLFMDARLVNSPTLIHADLATGKVRALSTSYKGYPKVTRVDVLPEKNRVNVVSINKTSDHRDLLVKVYEDNGSEIESYKIRSEDNTKLVNGTISKVADDKAFVIGTYSKIGEESNLGMYVSTFKQSNQIDNQLVLFKDIPGFSNYLDNDTVSNGSRVKRYRINPHELILQEDGYLLVAEAYYPIYKRESHTYFDAAGLPVTTYYQVFDGWQYTHGLIMSLDLDGKVQWSKTFSIDAVLSMNITEMVSVTKIKGALALVYIDNGKTVLQVIPNLKNEESTTVVEGMASLNHSNIEYWYNNYYISWTIENGGDQNRKKIIRCNKIDFK